MQFKLEMKGHKQDYFIIGLGIILTIIVVLIAYIATAGQKGDLSPTPPEITPAPTTIPPTPFEAPAATEKKYITYDKAASDRLLERVNNRPVLGDNDKVSKAKILGLFPDGIQSGVLYQTNTIVIDYTYAIDLFMVEIRTADVARAKAEANVWFRTQGMSQEGLCNLPLMFYIDPGVVQTMNDVDIEFSPVAPTC